MMYSSENMEGWQLILTVFWVYVDLDLKHYQERGTTVASAGYSDKLENELRPAICTKRRGKLSEGALSLHDSAGPVLGELSGAEI
jgi:hypothetical protein